MGPATPLVLLLLRYWRSGNAGALMQVSLQATPVLLADHRAMVDAMYLPVGTGIAWEGNSEISTL